MRFFTSDLHLNEKRIASFNPFFRPFKSVEEQNRTIIENINLAVSKDDTLYILGDVAMDDEGINLLSTIECKNLILVIGNYDEDKLDKLRPYFKEIKQEIDIDIAGLPCHLDHYPVRRVLDRFNITGHIHDHWKVKPNMVNVGVDAWHFRPVSEREILFVYDAIKNHYDENVFIGCNWKGK